MVFIETFTANMAPLQPQESISTDSSHDYLISKSTTTLKSFEQQEFEENTGNGVHSTIRIDSLEQDGDFSIEMLQH
jgi:hypothetical protein